MIEPIGKGQYGHNIYVVGLYGAGKSTALSLLSERDIPSLDFYCKYMSGRKIWNSEKKGIDIVGISDEEFDDLFSRGIIKDFYTINFNGRSTRYSCNIPDAFEKDNILSISVYGYNAMRPKDSYAKTICFDITRETSIHRMQNRPKEDRDVRIRDFDRFLMEMDNIRPYADDIIDTNHIPPGEIAARLQEDIMKFRKK